MVASTNTQETEKTETFHVEHSDLLTLNQCPVCRHDSFHHFITCKDYTVSQEDFNIVQCDECGFKFTNPRPADERIGEYYKSEDYVSHSDTNKGIINKLYHTVRKRAIKQKFALVKEGATANTLLDVGCGTGAFLDYCQQQGWDVLGLEPDADARQVAKEKHGLEALPIDALATIPDNSRDVITLWHVLEHITTLDASIEHFLRILKPGGKLIVAVPNCSSKDAAIYQQYWAAYDVPIHLYHFTPRDINLLFNRFNMTVEKTLPMKFDAYYVCMLSEKYKGGNMLKGFWNGWRSNLAASNTTHTWSSQIYVLKAKK